MTSQDIIQPEMSLNPYTTLSVSLFSWPLIGPPAVRWGPVLEGAAIHQKLSSRGRRAAGPNSGKMVQSQSQKVQMRTDKTNHQMNHEQMTEGSSERAKGCASGHLSAWALHDLYNRVI
jgi:hypothetical protein